MTAAKRYSQINGPGCVPMRKPIITHSRISVVKNQEFEAFFSDKDNVTMSSYRIDTKTNLPVLYLKDNKEALWKKFEETYPNGMKRTSFMARLTNGPYIYRSDLGGLCSICNEYFYEVFNTFNNMIQLNISNNEEKVIHKVF